MWWAGRKEREEVRGGQRDKQSLNNERPFNFFAGNYFVDMESHLK